METCCEDKTPTENLHYFGSDDHLFKLSADWHTDASLRPPLKPFALLCLLLAVGILCSGAGNCVCGGISSPNWKWAILLLGLKAVGLEFCSLEVGKRGMVSLTTRLPGYGCFESCNGNQRHKCSSVPLRMQTTWVCTPYVNLISATHCELSSLMCFIKPLIHCYTKCTSLMASLCFCMCEVLITGYKQSRWKSKHCSVFFCSL